MSLYGICRVLRPGGVCLIVTYGMPEYRLGLLNKFGWDITIYSIVKEPRLYTDSPGLMCVLSPAYPLPSYFPLTAMRQVGSGWDRPSCKDDPWAFLVKVQA